MRQGRDLGRNAALLQRPGNVHLPQLRAYQPFVKAVGLPELKADPVDGVEELPAGGALAEGREDAPLVRAQVLNIAVREAMQKGRIARLRIRDLAFALGECCQVKKRRIGLLTCASRDLDLCITGLTSRKR